MNRLFLLALLLPLLAQANPTPAPVFTDGAVLQQGCNVPVWGRAEPGERIAVSFRDQQVSTTTDPEGNWQVLLAPLAADTTESDLCIQGSTTVTLRRILVGEVWLFLGSTALQPTLSGEEDAAAQISEAELPQLRYLDAATATPGCAPLQWQASSPATAGHFSSEAFFFAKRLHRKVGLPIGIIRLFAPSAPLASWLSPAAINSTPSLAFIPLRWQEAQAGYPARMQAFQVALTEWTKAEQKARNAGAAKLKTFQQKTRKPREPQLHRPSTSFETLLAPLQAFAARGLLWHETEIEGMSSSEYALATRHFIQSTRAHAGNPNMPFIFVQLGAQAPQLEANEENWALFRRAQEAATELPNTAMVVSIDLGTNKAVHPFRSQELARRLAQAALATVYRSDNEYRGPSIRAASVANGKLRLDFDHASTGLIAYSKPVQSLEIAGIDGHFFPATAIIVGSSLIVSSPSVAQPSAVRYAWSNAPYANLANGAGLPASPFYIPKIEHASPPLVHHP